MSPFIQGSYIGSLAMAAADDIIIATAMVYLLRSQRTGVKRYWRLKIGGVLDIYHVICQHKLHSGQDHNIFHQYRTINQVRFQSTRVYGASHLALVLCKLSSSSPYVPYFIYRLAHVEWVIHWLVCHHPKLRLPRTLLIRQQPCVTSLFTHIGINSFWQCTPTLSWPCKLKHCAIIAQLDTLMALETDHLTAQAQCARVPQSDASHGGHQHQLPALGSAHWQQCFWEHHRARN